MSGIQGRPDCHFVRFLRESRLTNCHYAPLVLASLFLVAYLFRENCAGDSRRRFLYLLRNEFIIEAIYARSRVSEINKFPGKSWGKNLASRCFALFCIANRKRETTARLGISEMEIRVRLKIKSFAQAPASC